MFLLCKLGLLLWGEFSFILIFLKSDKFCVPDLNFLIKQKFDLHLREVDMSLTLSNTEV